MQNQKPRLTQKIAEKLLCDFFNESSSRKQEISQLKLFLQDISCEDNEVREYLFRILRHEANHVMIDTVLHSLPEEKQRYIKLKYASNKQYNVMGLSMELCVSYQQLGKWSQTILDDIYHATHFHLFPKDVYFRKKLINMLEVLAGFVATIQELDSNHTLVGKNQYTLYAYRYNQYRKILESLDSCMAHPEKNLQNQIVATVAMQPYAPRDEIASLCGCKTSTVSRYLHIYEQKLLPLLY